MFFHMYGLSLYFINQTDLSFFFCLLSYPLNLGLAVPIILYMFTCAKLTIRPYLINANIWNKVLNRE